MGRKGNLLQRVTNAADLPLEPVPAVPLVELLGDRRVLIENHKGVTAYGTQEICVKVSYGSICVCGDKLELAKMTAANLIITGRISGITVCRGSK